MGKLYILTGQCVQDANFTTAVCKDHCADDVAVDLLEGMAMKVLTK